MNVRLVHSHTLAREAGRIVYGNIMQVRMSLPVLVKDEQ